MHALNIVHRRPVGMIYVVHHKRPLCEIWEQFGCCSHSSVCEVDWSLQGLDDQSQAVVMTEWRQRTVQV